MEGRLAIVTNAGRDAVDAAARETNAVCLCTAKSCGSDAPIVGVKPVRRSAGDGVKKRGHRGEREVSRKTIARGMPGCSGVTVVTNSYAFLFCMRGCGCIARPAFPAPSDFRERDADSKPRAKTCGEIAKPCLYAAGCLKREAAAPKLAVIARSGSDEAIHAFCAYQDGLLRGACHRAALCADPLARNDVIGNGARRNDARERVHGRKVI